MFKKNPTKLPQYFVFILLLIWLIGNILQYFQTNVSLNVQRPVGVKKGVYNIIALMKSRQKIVEFKSMYRY